MGFIQIMRRGGEDYREFKKAVAMAKEAVETICELTEDMEQQYGEGGYDERGYDQRSSSRMRGGYSRREGWEEMDERRGRDSRGRFM